MKEMKEKRARIKETKRRVAQEGNQIGQHYSLVLPTNIGLGVVADKLRKIFGRVVREHGLDRIGGVSIKTFGSVTAISVTVRPSGAYASNGQMNFMGECADVHNLFSSMVMNEEGWLVSLDSRDKYGIYGFWPMILFLSSSPPKNSPKYGLTT